MSGMEEDAVDWDDVKASSGAVTVEADDVISLGGAEELEEEVLGSTEEQIVPVSSAAAAPAAAAPAAAAPNAKQAVGKEIAPVQIEATKEVTPQEKPLPPGWKVQEARSGGTYYFHAKTGTTTWDFPEDVPVPQPKPKTSSSSTTTSKPEEAPAEKLTGIQIRGSAKNQGAARLAEAPKKREAENESGKEDIPQKRPRSKSPPLVEESIKPAKRETWSMSPPPDSRAAASAPRQQEARRGYSSTNDREEEGLRRGGSNGRERDRDTHDRPRDESRRPQHRVEDERRSDVFARRHATQEPSREVSNGAIRGDNGYRSDRRDDRPSADPSRSRFVDRRREPSPRRRDDYPRGPAREASRREDNDRYRNDGRDRDTYRSDDPTRARDHQTTTRADLSRSSDIESRRMHDQTRQYPREDRDLSSRSVRSVDDSRDSRGASRNGVRGDRDYRYGRAGEVDAAVPRSVSRSESQSHESAAVAPPGPLAAPSRQPEKTLSGYRPYNGRLEQGGPPASPGFQPHNRPLPPQQQQQQDPYGAPMSQQGYPSHQQPAGRAVRPYIAPEEKQKKWWNKNSGEKKPVDPEAAKESEPSPRRGSATPTDPDARRRESEPRRADPMTAPDRGYRPADRVDDRRTPRSNAPNDLPSRYDGPGSASRIEDTRSSGRYDEPRSASRYDPPRSAGRADDARRDLRQDGPPRTDRERELEAREAAIARKERELGLRP